MDILKVLIIHIALNLKLANFINILQIFRLQEPASKTQLVKPTQSKENLIEKIQSLENELSLVKEEKLKLEEKLKSKYDANAYDQILREFETFISQILIEIVQLKEEKRLAQEDVNKIVKSFNDLSEKYNHAKEIIEGFKINEDILKTELKRSEDVIEQLNNKYKAFKIHADLKITEANLQLNKKDECNIKEVAKLTAKILESQSKIADLEKHVKCEDICRRNNMFDPLKSNIV